MSLEHSEVPQGEPLKISPLWLAARKVNDVVFERGINPVVYNWDAQEINSLAQEYGRQTLTDGPYKVLDIGSGIGGLGYAMSTKGLEASCTDVENHHAYPGIDFSPIVDGILPFKDGQFDLSVLRFVLHHIPKPDEALEEAKRVVKKDGLIAVYEDVVRPGMFERLHEWAYKGHLRNFNVTYPSSTPTGRTYTDVDWHDVFSNSDLRVVGQRSVSRIGPPVGHELYVVQQKEANTVFDLSKLNKRGKKRYTSTIQKAA